MNTFDRCKWAALLALGLGCAAGAAAQNMKAGLWTVNSTMQGQAGGHDIAAAQAQMQSKLASMSPEQRKMVEDMMAKRGVAMNSAGNSGGGTSIKMCVSKEMADRGQLPAHQQGNCKSEWSPRIGNTVKTSFTCANPPSTGSGEITFNGSDGYTSNMSITRTTQGKAETMTVQSSGKWLGTDCGTLKPMQMPAN